MQSFDLIETYAYETVKDVVSEKEDIRCNNIIKRYKNDDDATKEYFNDATKEYIKEHNPNWSLISYRPY